MMEHALKATGEAVVTMVSVPRPSDHRELKFSDWWTVEQPRCYSHDDKAIQRSFCLNLLILLTTSEIMIKSSRSIPIQCVSQPCIINKRNN
jgi:hypothetical protein